MQPIIEMEITEILIPIMETKETRHLLETIIIETRAIRIETMEIMATTEISLLVRTTRIGQMTTPINNPDNSGTTTETITLLYRQRVTQQPPTTDYLPK